MKDLKIEELTPEQVKNLSPELKAQLLNALNEDKQDEVNRKRTEYEEYRKTTVSKIRERVEESATDIKSLFDFVVYETSSFYEIMKEYGKLRTEGQMNYKIEQDGFKIEVKTNKIKRFDERANTAASRLVDFLQNWIKQSDKGADDPMYQLAMNMLERNQNGDFDYKSISKLYDLETKFASEEYSEIMQLFKESNKVDGTATNFYFSKKDEMGVWRKIEISFNRYKLEK